jgi:aspartate/methionine/tyrosine aminotransferase
MYKPTPSRPLLNLSQGVPGSAPPSILIDSFKRTAATEECYEYGSVAGDAGLRNALAEEMKGVYKGSVKVDVDVTGEDVMITTGCNIAFVAAVMSLAEKGDEVILPVPW